MTNTPDSPLTPLNDALAAELQALQTGALLRQRRDGEAPCSPHCWADGRQFLAFASNDYLGLANSPELIEAACEGARRWGVGAGASHLVSGHTTAHSALEKRLAEFVRMPAALSFSTGYLANIAVLPALLSRSDAVFADKLNHASLVDGALLSRALVRRYPHANLSALARLLETTPARRRIIVTDAVFSMDGDVAPLRELLQLAERYEAWLLVDDAHGFGVLGAEGRGALDAAGLQSERLILMGTLGKAAGVAGAFVAGSRLIIDWLLQKARPYIFTTAAPPMLAHTLLRAVDLIEAGHELRARLYANIAQLKQELTLTRWTLLPSPTAIQPVVIGDNAETVRVAEALQAEGLWVPAIRPPTVPAGSARLRISLSAAHGKEDVARLTEALCRLESRLS